MTKKPSEKNKSWEKDRRDRLNKAFDELAKLLPQYDPTVVWSKNDIIQNSIVYITDLQQKHEKVLESQDPKALNDYRELLDTIKFFRLRNNQLAELLKKANITIPAAKFPKLLSSLGDEDNLSFKPRPVGRPKKYSNLVVCNGNCNKVPSKENKENDNANKSHKDETVRLTSVESIVSSAATGRATSPAVTTASTTAVVTTTNATITAGVLLPLIPCQPLPQISNPPLRSLSNPTPTAKCNIISIQTLPRLNSLPRKLAKTKAGKVKILPYPVVKLHIRRTDNKVPIPALKRNYVAVKRKRRSRKRKVATKQPPVSCKRRKSDTVRDSVISKEEEKLDPQNKEETDPPGNHKNERNNQPDVAVNDKIDDHIPLPENDLPEEYFSSIHMTDVNPGSTSVSPTAAFLLSFPVVSANATGKNVCETEESSDGEQNERSGDNNNLSEGLENLTNFFSTKEYYRFCSQNASLADKVINEKLPVPDGLISVAENSGKNIVAAPLRNLLATPLNTTESLKATCTSVEALKPAVSVLSTEELSSQQLATSQNVTKESIACAAESPIVSTVNLLTSPAINKTSGYSSNFFVSSIFTTTAPSTVTSKPSSSVLLDAIPNSKKFISDLVKPVPDPVFGNLSKTCEKPLSNVLSSTSTCGFSSRFSASMSHPSKLNQIPNPIPAPLPHPTNFPNPSNSYPTFGKFTPGLTSESQYFDGNMQPTAGKSIRPTSVFALPSFDTSGSSHLLNKIPLSTSSTTTSNLPLPKDRQPLAVASNIPTSTSTAQSTVSNHTLSKSDKKGLLFEAPGKANQIEMRNYGNSSSSNQVKSSAHYPEKVRPVDTTATISSKSVPTISSSSKTPYPLTSNFGAGISHMESYSNLDNTLKSHIPTVTQAPPLTSSSKGNLIQHIETAVTDKPISSYPVAYPATTSYYYPQIVPPISTSFTFSLASATSSTITSSQPQSYLPMPNVIQNNEWTTPSTAIDYQTPFTFSLTSCTSTFSRSTQAVNSYPYYKAAAKNESNLKSSTNTLPSAKIFNPISDVPVTSLLCPPGSKGLTSTSTPQTATTNFTFSLAKPKNTNTTVSAQFMKTLPSSSVTDSKYPPYYNAYDYNNYSNSYSKEATNFTFALTKPTNSSSSSSQSTDVKAPQRFTGSFSIDATLGVSSAHNYQSQQRMQKHPQATIQGSDAHHKPADLNKPANFEHTASAAKNQFSYYDSNQEKQSKVVQKSHVNWMTSQSSELTSCRQQPSYYPPYVAPAVDYNNKGNYFAPTNIDDNFPPWSPSKILDTGHLFQSVPMQQPYYNELNSYVPNNSDNNYKTYSDAPKACSKPGDANGKIEKECHKSVASGSSSQTNFFSVSQLVDQNFSKPCETYSKRNTSQKTKDSRKNPSSSHRSGGLVQSGYANQKNSTSNYSAEALISKKEKHRNNPLPPSVQHYHNADYYSTQGDFLNSYVPQEPDNSGYNANYFFNYLQPNQSYMQDSEYPGCSQQDRSRSKVHSSTSDCKTVDKKHQSVASTSLTSVLPYESGNYAPPLASSVVGAESYDPIHYGNNIQHTSWNVSRNSVGNFPGGQAVIPFVGEEGNLASCVSEVGTGNSGNNLTNFNLSSICPEISGKVDHSNNW